ncbi:hypothetical protein [Embleya sp. NPDC005575]
MRCGARESDDPVTDPGVLVEVIRAAGDNLGVPARHSPWAPALTDVST